MKASSRDFREKVWPVLGEILWGGRLEIVEDSRHSTFNRELDMYAGIDAWQVHQEYGIRGIASRVQWMERWPGLKPWNTFTVRKDRRNGTTTEFEKRLAAIRSGGGWIYPHATVQAYLDKQGGRLLTVGLIETTRLFDVLAGQIEAGIAKERPATDKDGSKQDFYWEWFRRLGCLVWSDGAWDISGPRSGL